MTQDLQKPTLLAFDAFSDYLRAALAWLKKTGRGSQRQVARSLGLKSPATLTMIAKGQRQPSMMTLRRFERLLQWTATEKLYAETQLLRSKAPTEAERQACDKSLASLRTSPAQRSVLINSDLFIQTWYAATILEMFHLKDFRADAAWIAARLDHKVTPAQVKDVLELMLALGLIVDDGDGVFHLASSHFFTPTGVPRRAVRTFHDSMLKRAGDALRNHPLDRRFFASQTLAVKSDCLPDAKAYLNKVLDEFTERFCEKGGDEVYHCSLQFFRLTAPSAAPDPCLNFTPPPGMIAPTPIGGQTP